MTRISKAVLFGLAAALLAVPAARADNTNHFMIDRHAAQDGRGESNESVKMSPGIERYTPTGTEKPAANDFRQTAQKSEMPKFRTDITLRMSEDKDSVGLPGGASKTADAAAQPADWRVLKPASKLPIKSEISIKIAEQHDGDMPSMNVPNKGAAVMAKDGSMGSRMAMIRMMKGIVQMRVGSHGDGSGQSDER